jgi:3'-phosphoadenosine 5'-phosphosulfate sulfotransferase (PAPS reductase)/FAD synthetase
MSENVHDNKRLAELQALPLERKILITQTRIIEWYTRWRGQVYVSFSGGKDSTVLLHIARQCFPDIEAVFVNTGLEFPEIQKFAKSFDNVTVLRPAMSFVDVIRKYGYPIISKEVANCLYTGRNSLLRKDSGPFATSRLKRLRGELLQEDGTPSVYNCPKYEPLLYTDFVIGDDCCKIMKKRPSKHYGEISGKKPIIATMAVESKLRKQQWLKNGCNGFNMKSPKSNPMAFWTEQDVLEYIRRYDLPIAPVYGEVKLADDGCKLCTTGCDRTGCIFCGFGAHLDNDDRFLKLKETHPRQYDYCINGGEYAWVGYRKRNIKWFRIDFLREDGSAMNPEEIEKFVSDHKDDDCYTFEKVWMPNKQGLGMGHVFDEINKIYGENFIRYK